MEYSEVITCRHCGNIAHMEIRCTASDKIGEFGDESMGPLYDEFDCYEILKCPACEKKTVRSYYWNDNMESEDFSGEYEYLYPESKPLPAGLPEIVAKAYLEAEALRIKNVQAYVGQLRRLLEVVCNDRNAPKGKLTNRLKELAKNDEIPSKLVKVATGLKDFGDIGAHATITLSDEEVPIVSSLCNAILEYVYSAPHLADVAAKKLSELRNQKRQKLKRSN